jgi:hypothetical protein
MTLPAFDVRRLCDVPGAHAIVRAGMPIAPLPAGSDAVPVAAAPCSLALRCGR